MCWFWGGGGENSIAVGITGISEYIRNVIHIFIDPDCLDQFWGATSHLTSGNLELFPGGIVVMA
jgi:hypothetical protein